jgi:hypothetical protein
LLKIHSKLKWPGQGITYGSVCKKKKKELAIRAPFQGLTYILGYFSQVMRKTHKERPEE